MGTQLTIKCFHITDVCFGSQNLITQDGHMTILSSLGEKTFYDDPFIRSIQVRILPPRQRQVYCETIMDVLPLSTKALGRLGEGITHTCTGLAMLLTGVDEAGRQITNGGGCEGILQEQVAWGRPGTPSEDDFLVLFDVIAVENAWSTREGVTAIYQAFDEFCQQFRLQMKKFNPYSFTEVHRYNDECRPGLADVVILKEVSGQGAAYDTVLFPNEPCGLEGGRSIIDMGNMPVFLTPNQYRDGAVRALD